MHNYNLNFGMPNPLECWQLARVLSGNDVDGEQGINIGPYGRLVDHLARLPCDERRVAYKGFLMSRDADEEDRITKAIAEARPDESAPALEARRITATLADLGRSKSCDRFIWPNWLVRGHFNLLSSDPKIGKTYVTLDLARRIYFAEPWPDGQPPTFPAGTRTLWVCGDRHQEELLAYATAFGLPTDAILLNANPDDAYGGWDLDDHSNVELLRERVQIEKPGLVIIDTLWRATRRKLFKEDEVNALLNPLITITRNAT